MTLPIIDSGVGKTIALAVVRYLWSNFLRLTIRSIFEALILVAQKTKSVFIIDYKTDLLMIIFDLHSMLHMSSQCTVIFYRFNYSHV